MIVVEKSGIQTTLQDLGRQGWRHMGVPTSGAADRLSAALANRIVGNDINSVVVEVYLSEAEFVFQKTLLISITGAPCHPLLNKQIFPMYTPILVQEGDRLKEISLKSIWTEAYGLEVAEKLNEIASFDTIAH